MFGISAIFSAFNLSKNGCMHQKVKVKVFHSLIAVGAVGARVPLYLGHS